MKTSSYILIPATQFGTANENYNGADDFSGIPQKAAAYYSKDKSLQTLSWFLTSLVGVITIEATLDALSDTDKYFPIHTIGDGATPITENDFINLEGNYTWLRVTVSDFTVGSIDKISVGY